MMRVDQPSIYWRSRFTMMRAKKLIGQLKYQNKIFARPEDEETIAVDETHVPTEGEHASESERQRTWKDRQRQLRTV
jgi:hypothetical protein